jgi:hypothetical protein
MLAGPTGMGRVSPVISLLPSLRIFDVERQYQEWNWTASRNCPRAVARHSGRKSDSNRQGAFTPSQNVL